MRIQLLVDISMKISIYKNLLLKEISHCNTKYLWFLVPQFQKVLPSVRLFAIIINVVFLSLKFFSLHIAGRYSLSQKRDTNKYINILRLIKIYSRK